MQCVAEFDDCMKLQSIKDAVQIGQSAEEEVQLRLGFGSNH